MDTQYRFSKYTSIITRECKGYYDRALKQFGIGSGQQFFLINIYENPGINLADIAHNGGFDKSTITRSVKKLQKLDCIRIEGDEADGRRRHAFVTEKGLPVVKRIYEVKDEINQKLCKGLTDEEIEMVSRLIIKVAENAAIYLNE